MSVRKWCAGVWLILAAAIPGGALAAEPAGGAKPAEDAEEQLDDGLKGFGYLTGLALGCVTPEQRSLLEREALDLNAEVSRLFGADRAFLYAAAFGYGSGVTIKVDECKVVLERYEARVTKFRQGKKGGRS